MASYSTNMQYRRAPGKNSKALASEAPGIFQRSMKWRNERNSKIRQLRKQKQEQEGPVGLNFDSNYKEASVGEHLDAYHRYNMLVGEADGGVALSEAKYRKLEKRCAEAAKDRLFCTWRNKNTKMDCVNTGPMTRCFCGHSYRAHAFYRNQSKKVHCRVPDCKCNLFQYVYHRGGRAVKCQCKHDLSLHRDKYNSSVPCKHSRCNCNCFVPTVTCTCGESALMHETVFERRSEREGEGRLTQALWEEMEKSGGGDVKSVKHLNAGRDLARANRAMAAGAGGLTSYLSLAPGTDRVQIDPSSALPYDALRDVQEVQQMREQQLYNEKMSELRLREQHQLLEKQLREQDLRHSYDPSYEQLENPSYEQQDELSPLSKHMAEYTPAYEMPDVETDIANELKYVQQQQCYEEQQQAASLSPLSKHMVENSHKQVDQQGEQGQQRQQRRKPIQQRRQQQKRQQHRQPQHQQDRQPQRQQGSTSAKYQQRKQTRVKERQKKQQVSGGGGGKPLPSYMRATKATQVSDHSSILLN